jgi:hypothetical protein
MIAIFRYFICLLCWVNLSTAQELNAKVSIDASRLDYPNKDIFEELAEKIQTLLNTTLWSVDAFLPEERVACTFQIILKTADPEQGNFQGTMQITSSRPIYKTAYNTSMLIALDENIAFNYQSSDLLEYQDRRYNSPLVSIFAFYAFVVLGIDYDSFSEYGGTWANQKAQEIFYLARQQDSKNWDNTNQSKNIKFLLIENLNQNSFSNFRLAWYQYHRLGLDQLFDNKPAALKEIEQSIGMLKELQTRVPFLYLLNQFVKIKGEEVFNLFKRENRASKDFIYQTFLSIDGTTTRKYEKNLR